MSTPDFTAKLDALGDTLALLGSFDLDPLASALDCSCRRSIVAVGSGGSHIAASHLARCRETLGHGITLVQTPMQLVLDMGSLVGTEVWLFSAGANNADLAAAAYTAEARGCSCLVLCTRNPDGAVAQWVGDRGGEIVAVPVADSKDGFLATHSLLSTIVAVLLASDAQCGNVRGANAIVGDMERHIDRSRERKVRQQRRDAFAGLTSDTTLIVLADPRLHPLTRLLETSIWEAALCTIQVSDFRNFAHGRHTWLHHHPQRAFILSLTGEGSRAVWETIRLNLPSSIPVVSSDHGDCGRLANTFSAVDGLCWIEAMGDAVGVDPGKPSAGRFGKTMYNDPVLLTVAATLSSQARHKLASAVIADSGARPAEVMKTAFEEKMTALCETEFEGLVMDYDGTVVTTEGRFDPPDEEIVEELIRLNREGMAIGFASGRGKSLGRVLRDAFPAEITAQILVGYYNGGHLRAADVDITDDRPAPDPAIGEIATWLAARPDLFLNGEMDRKEIQIEMNMANLRSPHRFPAELMRCPAIADGQARVLSSAHSFDIVPSSSSKLRVIDAIEKASESGGAVLSIGDSGTITGNDHALLARPHGISVDTVCPDLAGCWSLFGSRLTGPAALLRILRAMLRSDLGGIRLNRDALGLDIPL